MTESLTAARIAETRRRLDERFEADGKTFSHRERLFAGAYEYRVEEHEEGQETTYGMIVGTDRFYETPVIPVAREVFDFASHLPVVIMDHDKQTATLATD